MRISLHKTSHPLICAHTTHPVRALSEPPLKRKIITQIVSPPNHEETHVIYDGVF